MNILNKVALQSMKKSRARTIVTIIGVILSTAMITAVSSFAVSLQTYLVNINVEKYGDWHVAFMDTDETFAQTQAAQEDVLRTVRYENIGYALLQDGKNVNKPYLFIAGFDEAAFQDLPVQLLAGRLPQNSEELLIPAHVENNGGVKIGLGDTITLPIGQRTKENKILSQHDPFVCGADGTPPMEIFTPVTEKTYTVVGLCQRPAFEEFSAPGYTLITAADADTAGSFTTFVTLQNPRRSVAYADSVESSAHVFNNDVLRFMGCSDDHTFNLLLYTVSALLIGLIMLGSVFLIYNSFTISLNDRTHQFGILMSVGATEKQLRKSVLFEGICIGVLGIPLGILTGLMSIKLVLALAAQKISVLNDTVSLSLTVSLPALAAASVFSLITICISAYLPAKKAASVPILACIRQTNAVKLEAKALQIPRAAEHICGLEGTLALKNFKRNKSRYRSIVLSLTLSIVLFVSASAFSANLQQVADQAKMVTDYDVGLSLPEWEDDELVSLYELLKSVDGVTGGTYQILLSCTCQVSADQLSDAYWTAASENMQADTATLNIDVQVLSDEQYFNIVQFLDLPWMEDGQIQPFLAVGKLQNNSKEARTVHDLQDLFKDSAQDITLVSKSDGASNSVRLLFTELVPPDTPPVLEVQSEEQPYYLQMLVPWSLKEQILSAFDLADIKAKGLTFQSDDPAQSAAQMKTMLEENGIVSGYMLYNVYEILEENRSLQFVVNLFTLVFVAMISLIAVANVFNTISTNLKLRRRELAMLRSVGMADRDFNKMMCLECIFYGAKTLLYGVPLASIFSLIIYQGMQYGGADIAFTFPWKGLLISVLGVFLVIFITTLYAVRKLKQENIIEALRDDMT